MGVNGRLAGVGVSVEHERNTYTLGPITPVVKGRFEDWMFRRAALNLERQRALTMPEGDLPAVLSPERFAEIEGLHNHNVLCDGYSWGTPAYQLFVNSPPGRDQLTLLCLRVTHTTATEELAATLWDEHRKEMTAALQQLLTRPNLSGRQAPAETSKPGVSVSA
jgi:hypothetical protein